MKYKVKRAHKNPDPSYNKQQPSKSEVSGGFNEEKGKRAVWGRLLADDSSVLSLCKFAMLASTVAFIFWLLVASALPTVLQHLPEAIPLLKQIIETVEAQSK